MGTVNSIQERSAVAGPNAPETPAPAEQLILGKFKTQGDLEKAYKELESKIGAKPAEEAPAAAETPKVTPPVQTPTTPQAEVPTEKLAKFQTEFSEKGSLSEASYTELEGLGYTKSVVDSFIAGQKVIADSVFAEAGGEADYKSMLTWAATGLSATEQKAFNNAVNSGDVDLAKMAVRGVHSKFTQTYGKDPNLLGGKGANSGAPGFASYSDMLEAMKNPKYKSDPDYIKSVERRVAASTAF